MHHEWQRLRKYASFDKNTKVKYCGAGEKNNLSGIEYYL
jgi:hypothetical protein